MWWNVDRPEQEGHEGDGEPQRVHEGDGHRGQPDAKDQAPDGQPSQLRPGPSLSVVARVVVPHAHLADPLTATGTPTTSPLTGARCPDGVLYPPLDARSGHPRRVSYGRATVVMTSPVPVCHSNTTASVVGKMIVPATVLPAWTGPMSMFAVLMSPDTTKSCALR